MPIDLPYIKKEVFDFKYLQLNDYIKSKVDLSKFLTKNFFIYLNEDFTVLKDYKWKTKKDPEKELLCVKVDFTDGKRVKKLITIKKTDVTCWNLFLRFLGYGKLVGIDYSLSRVAKHVAGILKDKQSQKFNRIPADSPVIENIQNIYDRIKTNSTKNKLREFLDFILQEGHLQQVVEEDTEENKVKEQVIEEVDLQEKVVEIDVEEDIEENKVKEQVIEEVDLQEKAVEIDVEQHKQRILKIFPNRDYRDVKLEEILPKITELKDYLNQNVAVHQRKEILDYFVDKFSMIRPSIACLRLILLGLKQLNETHLLNEFKETIRRLCPPGNFILHRLTLDNIY